MAFKILVMGLSGSGKTTISQQLVELLSKNKTVEWFNADDIRTLYDDWDFSSNGRIRQATRLRKISNNSIADYVICDFIAPLPESRNIFNADFIIWMNTTKNSKYEDTDQAFIDPHEYNYMISDFDNINLPQIVNNILGLKHNFDVLYNIQIPEVANSHTLYSGMDTLEECVDKHYFINYNKIISYNYNSRGFRDVEWKDKNLSECIWCFGDSFTVGLGQPQNEIWSNILAKESHQPTINVSLDGASVNWITRQIIYVLKEIHPKNIVIQWTFLHRREKNDHSINDKNRRLANDNKINDNDDLENYISCLQTIKKHNLSSNIIHSWIPNILPKYKYDFLIRLLKKLKLTNTIVNDNTQLDYARDYFHYDIKTTNNYVNNYIKLIKTW